MTTLRAFRPVFAALLLALAVGTVQAQDTRASLAAPPRAPRPAVVPVDVSTLPTFSSLTRGRTIVPLEAGFSLSDSFLIQSYGFDDHTGVCRTSGWQGLDLTTKTYWSISGRYLVNQAFWLDPQFQSPTLVRTPIGSDPVAALGRFVGPIQALGRDGAGNCVAVLDTLAPSGAEAFAVRLVSGNWVRFGTDLPPTLDPAGMTWDAAHGRVLVFDRTSGELLGLPDAGGPLQYVAGNPGGSSSDTLGTLQAFTGIRAIACDASGRVYFAEPGRIRMLRADGRVVTIAGNGTDAIGPDGVPATSSTVAPTSIAVDAGGSELLLTESGSRRVRRIDLTLGTIAVRYDLASDPRFPQVLGVDRSAASWLVRATVPATFGEFASYVVLASEGDSLRRVAGSANLDPRFDVPPGSPEALRRGIERFELVTEDGAGGLFFTMRSDNVGFYGGGFDMGTTGPIQHFVAGATMNTVAGVAIEVAMGSRAFDFGAATLSPEEVYPDGINQWLLSPPVSTTGPGGIRVALDLAWLARTSDSGDYLRVEGEMADGSWQPLHLTATGDTRLVSVLYGTGGFGVEIGPTCGHIVATPSVALPGVTRVRVRVKNTGMLPLAPGPCVLDNLVVTDGNGTPLVPMTDFEDGSTGPWTLGVHDGAFENSGSYSGPDFPLPGNVIAPVANYDFGNTSCAWSFFVGRDSLPAGTDAAIVSPWVPVARADSAIYVIFSGKLTGYVPDVELRGVVQTKSAAGAVTGEQTFGPFVYGGTDIEQPYWNGRSFRYMPPTPVGVDSVRVLFRLRHNIEGFPSGHFGGPGHAVPTRYPYLDDIRIVQLSADHDFDGVADRVDACSDESSIGQDTDGDGCVDPTATLRHVETWPASALPIVWHLSSAGDPRIGDGSTAAAVRAAFQNWKNVARANVPVTEGAPVAQANASSTDGINLVTFTDPDFQFPDNVVAVTPTLSFARRGAFDDQMHLPGQILDADILFNPAFRYGTSTWNAGPGAFDLESVATHEIGHLLGLSHSGVLDASMFYVLQAGTDGRSLTEDDQAAIGAAYPAAAFGTGWGTLRGRVTRGGTHELLGGALVTAVRLASGLPADSVASDYTDEQGRFALRGLAPGTYGVRVTPLDGEVGGFPLLPEDISQRVANIATTNFDAEWWSPGDSDRDDPNVIGTIDLAAGQLLDSVNVVTNVDTLPPSVVALTPADGSSGVRIDAPVLVRFDQRLDRSTFTGSTFVLRRDDTNAQVPGFAYSLDDDRAFSFTADPALAFGTAYTLTLTTGITDRSGLPMAADVVVHFQTMAAPPVAIADVQPRQVPPGAFVTITGDGFDATPGATQVTFSVCGSCGDAVVTPSSVTPSAIVVAVPAGAVTGPVTVTSASQASNPFGLTLLPASGQSAPSPLGSPIALGFAPVDVSVAADGRQVYAVGDAGLVVIDRSGVTPTVRTFAIGAARSVVVAPARDLLYASRPDSGDVVAVGADPAVVATFGRIVARIPVAAGGRPDGVVLSAAATRLVVGDANVGVHYVIDTDARSLSRFQVLRELRDSSSVPTGGLALVPQGDRILYTTSNHGIRQFATSDTVAFDFAAAAAERGAAVAITGREAVFAGGLASPGKLVFVDLGPSAHPTSTVDLGGMVRDVATTPQGLAALAVNSTFDRLQVVGLDPASAATFHQRLAEVSTGSGPVAVATSAAGDLVAVANGTGRSVSLYGAGSSAALVRIVPPAAVAGARVAFQASGAVFAAGASADFGGSPSTAAVLAPDGTAAGVAVPTGAQQVLSAAAVGADARRTNDLAFTRLDPVTRFAPVATTLAAGLSGGACANAASALASESPLGTWLGVGHATSGPCTARVDLFDARAGAAFTTPVASADLGVAGALSGLAFRADESELWAVQPARASLLVVSLAAGPGFGQLATSSLAGVDPAGLAADPLGRWMCVADAASSSVLLVDPVTRAVASTLPLGGTAGPLAVSPDGRFLVAARGGGAAIFDLTTRTLAGTTPAHAGPPSAITITADARRAVATYPGDHAVAVWNLDASTSAVGLELAFAAPGTGTTAAWSTVCRAPDAAGVVVGAPDGSELARLEVAGNAPEAVRANALVPSLALANSADGRRLWSVVPGSTGAVLFALDDATRFTVVSGAGQSGPPGTLLPLPVVVRVEDGDGNPEAGVAVRLATSGALPGTLDGGATTLVLRSGPDGLAATGWTLPASAGATQLTISAPGLAQAAAVLGADASGSNALISPQITELGPADGATGILAGSPLFARFNQPMDSLSLVGALQLTSGGSGSLPGAFSLAEGRTVAIFQPQSPLAYGQSYTWSVNGGALDSDGQSLLSPAQAGFTVEPAPTLSLASVYPPAGPVGTVLTLAGTGFPVTAGLHTVRVGGVVAPVTSATATTISVLVPEGAPVGPVTVTDQVGATTSNALAFQVHETDPDPTSELTRLLLRPDVSAAVVAPDGLHFYFANPRLDQVSVAVLTSGALLADGSFATGHEPVALALTPDGRRLYVANAGSHDLWVFASDSGYVNHRVVATVPLGGTPRQIAYSAKRQELYVLTGATLQVVDAQPGNTTYHQVTSTVNTGSTGTAIVISPDGGEGYVLTSGGTLLVVDLRSRAVTSTVNTGSSGTAIVITPDGGLLVALLADGRLIAIDNNPVSSRFHQVTSTVNTGTGGTAIVITPDGGSLYAINESGQVVKYQITGHVTNASLASPAPVGLVARETFDLGRGAGSLAVDPLRGRYFLATSPGTGEAVLVGVPDLLVSVVGTLELQPNTIQLRSEGRWIHGTISLPAPSSARDIDVASIRLQGTVPCDTSYHVLRLAHEHECDSTWTLRVRFDRIAVQWVVSEGDSVPVTVTGRAGDVAFRAVDVVRVRRGTVTAPHAHEVVRPGQPYVVRWSTPKDVKAKEVAILASFDGGMEWTVLEESRPNTGSYTWSVPAGYVPDARIAVALIEEVIDPDSLVVEGVLATSDAFSIVAASEADGLPAVLSFAPAHPNPASGRALFRFGLPVRTRVSLELYDLLGRRVRTLADGVRAAGWHEIAWRGDSDAGAHLHAGVYFARFRAQGREFRQRLVWLE